MNIINSFIIDTSDMSADAQQRAFEVEGSVGSKFLILALQDSTLKYYNFSSGTFEAGHVLDSNLIVTMSKSTYRDSFSMPTGGGDFLIKLIPLEDTLAGGGIYVTNEEGDIIKEGSVSAAAFNRKITKIGSNITLTFQPNSDTVNAGGDPFYGTFPTFTSVGFGVQNKTTPFSLTIDNVVSDQSGFGFIVQAEAQDITEEFFFYSVTDTVNQDVNASTTVVVDDLTGIVVGTKIYGVSSGSLSGTPSVTSIDTTTKTLTLSAAQTFGDGITLTFRSYGKANIKSALGLNFSVVRSPITTFNSVTQVVRASSSGSSTNVALVNTFGVSAGTEIKGLQSISGTTVSSITQADADGSNSNAVIVISAASITKKGQKLAFGKTSTQAVISGIIKVSEYPSANASIKLDIDKFLTPGTSS